MISTETLSSAWIDKVAETYEYKDKPLLEKAIRERSVNMPIFNTLLRYSLGNSGTKNTDLKSDRCKKRLDIKNFCIFATEKSYSYAKALVPLERFM